MEESQFDNLKTNENDAETNSTESSEISVICTVRNESENIKELIRALQEQTLQADEIIFVDGGSTDDTIPILSEAKTSDPKIILIEAKGANIAQGRNIGIKAAKNEIIAVTDAGAKPKRDWLEQLFSQLDASTDVISGFYLPDARSKFEWLVGELTFPKIENVNQETFLPSSRSILFRRKCWKEVGGYPEESLTGEDTLFDIRLKEKQFRFRFAKNAIVLWRCRRNLRSLFKQWYGYAKGDGMLGIIFNSKQARRHYLKILAEGYGTIALIILGILVYSGFITLLLVLLPSYLFLYYMKRKDGQEIHKKTRYLQYLLLGPTIIGVIHLGQFLGIHRGSVSRWKVRLGLR